MFHIKLCALIAAMIGLSLPGLAHAQIGLSTKPNYDATERANQIDEGAQRDLNTLHNGAIEALQAKNFVAAEELLINLVGRNPTTEDASFLMGLAKMGLEKWGEARTYLEAAVKKQPARPEPKTRLGLAYVKLKNPDAAKRQRAELASLDAACKGACADANWIKDGLFLLDEALGAPTSTTLAAASTPSGTPAETLTAETLNFDPAKYNL